MSTYITRIVAILALLTGVMIVNAAAQSDPIVGGYGPAGVTDRAVKQAAAVAVRDHARKEHHSVSLVRIVKAEQQVVSGMNYRLCLRVRRPHHKAHNVTAVVYQPIRKKMRLTDWTEGGCED